MRRVGNTDFMTSVGIRIKIIAFLFLLPFLVLIYQAYTLQIVKGPMLSDAANRQTIANVIIEPKRGDILDRNQEELAISVDSQSLYIRPKKLGRSKNKVKHKLIELFPNWEKTINSRFQSKSAFVWVLRKLPPEDVDKIIISDVLDYEGVGLMEESSRYYRESEFIAPILGFVDFDGFGRMGIERTFDDILRGKKIRLKGIRDAKRDIGLGIDDLAPLRAQGATIVLTIDKYLQHLTEIALRDGVERADAKRGVAIVANPKTGEILALSQWPSFDSNRYYDFTADRLHNYAVENVFEPGSTLKVVTISAALDAGVVSATDEFNCYKGVYQIGPNRIHDSHHYKEEVHMTVEEILVKSSNIGTAQIGEKLGAEALYNALKSFGFGQKTGLSLPGEVRGLLRHWKKWYPIDLATISFGQGISTTPVQVLQMVNTVANDGVLVPLKLVKSFVSPEGEVISYIDNDRKPKRVLKAKTAKLVRSIMQKVVGDEGTAKKAAIEGVSIAGKTGTAQKYDPKIKRYSKKKWTSWFVGMVPADNPKLSVVVLIDEPGGKHYYGGDVAAPVFRTIVEEILRHYGELVGLLKNKDSK